MVVRGRPLVPEILLMRGPSTPYTGPFTTIWGPFTSVSLPRSDAEGVVCVGFAKYRDIVLSSRKTGVNGKTADRRTRIHNPSRVYWRMNKNVHCTKIGW